jgi:serine/threonine protein kinase
MVVIADVLTALSNRKQSPILEIIEQLQSNLNIPHFVPPNIAHIKSEGGSKDIVFKYTGPDESEVLVPGRWVKVFVINKQRALSALSEVLFTIMFDRLFDLSYTDGRRPFPNILGLSITKKDTHLKNLAIVMDTVPGSSVYHIFCEGKTPDQPTAEKIVSATLLVVHLINLHMWSYGFVYTHADLHPGNIFIEETANSLNEPESGKRRKVPCVITFIDFGWARVSPVNNNFSTAIAIRELNLSLPRSMSERISSKTLNSLHGCKTFSSNVVKGAMRNWLNSQRPTKHRHIDLAFWLEMAVILVKDAKPVSLTCKTSIDQGDPFNEVYESCKGLSRLLRAVHQQSRQTKS